MALRCKNASFSAHKKPLTGTQQQQKRPTVEAKETYCRGNTHTQNRASLRHTAAGIPQGGRGVCGGGGEVAGWFG